MAMTRWKTWIPSWLKPNRLHAPDDVVYRSIHQNLYHCTVQKCASQWIRLLLSDQLTFKYCGLTPYQYQQQLPGKFDPRKLTERRFASAFPFGTIATPIYVDFAGYASIPKPAHYKAIFVMRDPRDVVVSWYFSAKLSHKAQGDLERVRQDLLRLDEADGLRYAIDYLADFGLFAAQRSWADAPANDANVLLVRFEDLIGPEQLAEIERLWTHCDIRMPCTDVDELLTSQCFERLSGRRRGDEDARAHFRKGVAGDWRNHFTDAVHARFHETAGDVLDIWKYS